MPGKEFKKFICLFAVAVSLFICAVSSIGGIAWGAENSFAPHFPAADILYTDKVAVYYLHLKIDGLPAQAGDEVAFFDLRGKICGWAIVEDVAELAVFVYGDDGSVEGVSGGPAAGEALSVRVWDAGAGVELSGSALALSGGGNSDGIVPSAIPPVWGGDNFRYALDIDTATHFGRPTPTPPVSYYIGHVSINGAPAAVGDELAVFDQKGVLSGAARLMEQGEYVVAVYGDDLTTAQVDEGAVEGEILIFKIWDRSATREYGGSDLRLAPGLPRGESFFSSAFPPLWSAENGYVLDIYAATMTKGDVNGDTLVDVGDAILALRVCVGLASVDVYQQADVSGNGRIGMEEAVYILQKVSGLR